jgi:uncharacterized protein YndB with AHSA1/START domain
MDGKSNLKLEVTVVSDTEILLKRTFDAPPRMVWEVMTKPEYVRRWWCCMEGFTMPVCEIDLRVGGKWRYVMRGADGQEFAFRGEYREIEPAVRVVNTEIFEPVPDHPALVISTYRAQGERTLFEALVQHDSQQSRDMHLQSGMEQGAAIAYDRLDAVARELWAASRT